MIQFGRPEQAPKRHESNPRRNRLQRRSEQHNGQVQGTKGRPPAPARAKPLCTRYRAGHEKASLRKPPIARYPVLPPDEDLTPASTNHHPKLQYPRVSPVRPQLCPRLPAPWIRSTSTSALIVSGGIRQIRPRRSQIHSCSTLTRAHSSATHVAMKRTGREWKAEIETENPPKGGTNNPPQGRVFPSLFSSPRDFFVAAMAINKHEVDQNEH